MCGPESHIFWGLDWLARWLAGLLVARRRAIFLTGRVPATAREAIVPSVRPVAGAAFLTVQPAALPPCDSPCHTTDARVPVRSDASYVSLVLSMMFADSGGRSIDVCRHAPTRLAASMCGPESH